MLAVRTPPSGIVHGYRLNNANMFIQDDFKATSRLTLNLGLRWEFDGYPTDKYGNLTNIWLSQIQKVPVPGTSSATGTYSGFVAPANYQGVLPAGHSQKFEQRPDPHGRAVEQLCSAHRLRLAAHRQQQAGGARWLRFLL